MQRKQDARQVNSADDFRGSFLMVLAMAGFAIEDMFIKQISAALPVGQILLLLGAGGALIFALILHRQGQRVFTAELLLPSVMMRNLCEVIGTLGFVTAITLIPISTASTILQAVPLVVTLGAVFFLGAKVGWRRWSAIFVGFCGVMLVLRPGLEGFDPQSLYAVLGVVGLALRDIASRKVPAHVSSLQLSTWGFLTLVPLGAALIFFSGTGLVRPDPTDTFRVLAAILMGVAAYYAIVAASRTGEVAVVAPFRYSRIVFALMIGMAVFDERPDALTLTGAAIIVASGIYTLLREARVRRASLRSTAAL